MKKIFTYTTLSILLLYVSAYLYVYDPIRDAHIREQIEKSQKYKDEKSSSDKSDGYESCGKMSSSGRYVYKDYKIEFFHPSCRGYNHYCYKDKYCGMAGLENSRECKEGVDCNKMLSIVDQQGQIVLEGVDEYSYKKVKLDPNKEIFGHTVKLQEMPKDFPYFVLKDTTFGSWGQGYYYHLYSAEEGFKKIVEIGPSYKGFYRDDNGNYIIDIQHNYWPEYGNNSDRLVDEISFRLTNEEEYLATQNRFIVDVSANKARVIKFSNNEIDRLMTYAKESNKKITQAFTSNDWHYFWTPDSPSKTWPLALLRIRESDPSEGYVYADLFNFIRNGRIDLARQYFDILTPEKYNQFKEILPENLNSKDKLWTGYLKDLKEQGEYRRHGSDSLYFPGEFTKDLYWSVFKLINSKHDIFL